MNQSTCSVPACNRKYRCSGYCELHYYRSRSGVPLEVPHRDEATIAYKLQNYTITPDGCFEFNILRGGTTGYGVITHDGRRLPAHRVSYEVNVGPIPEGQMVLHSCDNPPCINPEHLWTGTAKDNQQDAIKRNRNTNQRKTRCPQGHEYDYVSPKGGRGCLTCRKKQSDAHHARQRA